MDKAFDRDTLVLLARGFDVDIHQHHAVQLVVSLDQPFDAELQGRKFEQINGFLANAEVPHACRSAGSKLLIISVDASSRKGVLLKQTALKGKPFRLLPEIAPPTVLRHFIDDCNRAGGNTSFDYLSLLRRILPALTRDRLPDARVVQALALLRRRPANPPRLNELAAAAQLSESRFSHLFREEVGISLKSYLVWLRMRRALELIARPNMTLTAAAHEAGFSDHPHFSRSFSRMFGIPPSILQEKAEFLRVFH